MRRSDLRPLALLVACLALHAVACRRDEASTRPGPPVRTKSLDRSPEIVAQRRGPDHEEAPEPTGTTPDARIHAWLQRAGRDTPGTLRELMRMDDDATRAELLEWILNVWTAEDRTPALEWLVSEGDEIPENMVSDVIEILIGSWAADEPLEAVTWARRFPREPMRGMAVECAASTWALADPTEMGEWIDTMPVGNDTDFWIEELVHGLAQPSPETALTWCARISEPDRARRLMETVVSTWMLSDPVGAGGFLALHPELPTAVPAEAPAPSGGAQLPVR